MSSKGTTFSEKLSNSKPQILASLISSVAYLQVGLVRSWASTSVPSLNLKELNGLSNYWVLEAAPLSPDIIAWIVSISPFGAMCGALVVTFPLNYAGRKPTILLSGVLFAVCWGLIALASLNSSVAMILVGRFFSGLGTGVSVPSVVVYLSEVTAPSVRGFFGCIPALLMALGVLLGYGVGSVTSWHQLAYLCLVPNCILLIGMLFMPESPVWLKRAGKLEASALSAKWFNLEGFEIESAADVSSGDHKKEIPASLEHTSSEKTQGSEKQVNSDSQRFLSRGVLHPLCLSLVLMIVQNFSGVNVLIFKTVEIFTAVGSSIDDYVATITVGVVQLISTAGSVILVDKTGRRPLLMTSSLVMCASMSTLGACFYVQDDEGRLPDGLGWLPLVAIILAFVGYSAGFGSVPYLIMGEIFPARVCNACSSIASAVNLFCLFSLLRFFSVMADYLTFHGVFWLYSCVCFAGFWFVFLLLPETKGRSKAEIEAVFQNKMNLNSVKC